jgi:hypothetical protein
MSKIIITANVPRSIRRAFLQHVRDFDLANPGCHFKIIAFAKDETVDEALTHLDIDPPLPHLQVIGDKP